MVIEVDDFGTAEEIVDQGDGLVVVAMIVDFAGKHMSEQTGQGLLGPDFVGRNMLILAGIIDRHVVAVCANPVACFKLAVADIERHRPAVAGFKSTGRSLQLTGFIGCAGFDRLAVQIIKLAVDQTDSL